METTRSSSGSPTRAEMWDELCSSRDELVKVLRENNDVTKEVARSLDRNTESTESIHAVVVGLQRVIETLMTRMVDASIMVSTGVQVRVFLIVVGVMAIIIMVLLGLSATDMKDFLK